MAQDKDYPTSDLKPASSGGASGKPSEDPLVELARIVNRNKPAEGSAASDRVGRTDYFAALDDVAVPAAGGTGRVEPSFGSPAPQGGADEPYGYQEPVLDSRAPTQAEAYVRNEGYGSRSATEHVDQPYSQTYGLPAGDVGASGEAAYGASGDAAYGAADDAYDLSEADIPQSGLDTGVALDLEANLTAELEDELVGAFRQSFEPQREGDASDFAAPEPDQDVSAGFEPQISETQDHSAQSAQDEAYQRPQEPADDGLTRGGYAYEVRSPTSYASDSYASDPYSIDRPAVSGFGSYSEGAAPHVEPDPVPAARSAPSSFEPDLSDLRLSGEDSYESEQTAETSSPQGSVPRDTLEDDLFAALGPSVAARTSNYGAVNDAPASRDEPQTEFDNLFDDGLPDDRLSGDQGASEQDADDIDNMTWPAAAASVPNVSDDETPPPPGGYDLDAVARAMKESDPTLGNEGVLPPHPRAEKAAAPKGETSRKGLYAAAAVLAVAVIGGGAFMFTDGSGVSIPDGPPPVIAGLQGPLKVYPDDAPEQADSNSSKLIYDRVGSTDDPSRERLVLPEQTQPAELPPAPAGATGVDPLVPGAPKRVRTLVVRPDGTIVAEPETPSEPVRQAALPAASQPAPAQPETSTTPDPSTPRTVSTSPVSTTPVTPTPVTTTPVDPAAPETTPVAATSETPVQPQLSTPALVTPETDAAATEQPAIVPSVTPKKKPDAPVRVSAAPQPAVSGGPLDLNNPAPAPARQQAAAAPAVAAPAPAASTSGTIPAGTYVVQVTSQRSESAARDAYAGLQRRFPQVLGGREAVIVSANIDGRGTFYRARIPAQSRADAISLCEGLQAAGGDCFVRRN